ncbi:MAG: insulinase family protein [Microbacteriaceae bacterium]|nr:insulinase family protein [Microbacteriaceae bacterium]
MPFDSPPARSGTQFDSPPARSGTQGVLLPIDQRELRFEAAGGTRVARTLHPSGLRILTEQVAGSQSATIGFWIPAGSRDEAEGAYGSTHFLEHLLFKGTPSRSALDIAVSFDEVGGDHNAVTAKEYTCYYAKVRDRDVPMAVTVLADMIAASVIDPEEFETERGVILEELAAADDDPGDVVGERFAEAVFGAHPLARPIGGSPASIEAVGRDAVLAHYHQHYRPSELVVTAAGAVDHERIVDLVVAGLAAAGWDMDAPAAPLPRRSREAVRIAPAASVVAVDRRLEQVNLVIGAPGLTGSADDRPAMAVLSNILGGGMSSRLFQEVREKRGLVYSVYAFAPGYSDAGSVGMAASCTPKKAGEVVRVMSAEFERLAVEPVSEHELRRAVGYLSGAGALALEDSDSRMNRLGRAELSLGEFVDLDEWSSRLEAVSAEDVLALARRLVAEPRVTAAVGPVREQDLAS